jgi:ApaG protein
MKAGTDHNPRPHITVRHIARDLEKWIPAFGKDHAPVKNVMASPTPFDWKKPSMYRAVTRKIEVTVTPRFVSERSSPNNGYYFWAYTIDIANLGVETVQLKTRHWRITDALGRLQEVKGPGVVGEEPTLKPGESFEYTSGVPLPTPSGFMVGSYGMVTEAGEPFDIEIPAFSLDSSYAERTIN